LKRVSFGSIDADHPFVPTAFLFALRAGGVRAGRRPPPEAARSGLDPDEQRATIDGRWVAESA
jgi:hypothetical protein